MIHREREDGAEGATRPAKAAVHIAAGGCSRLMGKGGASLMSEERCRKPELFHSTSTTDTSFFPI